MSNKQLVSRSIKAYCKAHYAFELRRHLRDRSAMVAGRRHQRRHEATDLKKAEKLLEQIADDSHVVRA